MGSKPVEKTANSQSLPRSPELMNRSDSAFLVIDAQEKLLSVVPDRKRIVWNIRRLLDAAKELGVAIAGTEQYPDRLSPTVPELKERLGSAPDKLCFSAGVCGDVFERWKADGRFRVLLTGIETHVCVLQTALDLAAAGFEVYVAVDAVGARKAVDHDTALRRMELAGVVLTTTETAMFEWCQTAEVPEFKRISALAKEQGPS
ncbi:MAG TPA: hydrolase [Lacipirellulaceae bacterium]|jgi:nicotinamidase-related amidase|nr:hydrolase [Lacipirellulaceae bacterium]